MIRVFFSKMHLTKIISLFTLFFTFAAAQYDDEYADEAALERREMVEGFREEYRAARDLEPRVSDSLILFSCSLFIIG